MDRRKTVRMAVSDKMYYVLRIAVLILAVFLFFPGLNPAKVSGVINRNLSLFTTGISYGDLANGFGRAIGRGWIAERDLRLVQISAVVVCLGIAFCVAGACMSLGNIRMKKTGNLTLAVGNLVGFLGLGGIYLAYQKMLQSSNPDKIQPMFPGGFWVVLGLFACVLAVTVGQTVLLRGQKAEQKFEIASKYKLFLMFLPFISLIALFAYLPLWGWRYAFFNYEVGDTLSMDSFVGLKWFQELVRNPATVRDILRVLRNTLAMSGIGLATSWLPMVFAIFLNEVKNLRFRRVVQTFTTIPNFISWVLVYGVAFSVFSTEGFVSSMLVNMGVWEQGQNLLMSGAHTWLKMWAWGTWKGIGWSAIIYIAGISGIDAQLYDAAMVDGAGRFQRMWHITLPGLLPTFCVLLLMSVGNILSNGMDQYLVFENATNTDAITVLDLYVYKLGIGGGRIPLTTVVSMLKSIVGVVLLLVTNNVAKLTRGGESIV
ncbi:MAG: sugar ABC transporter permease [Lachnospiraceae bacterium]|nr:sugar ABC transporter permease [Lachnospiraceae bacterium]